MTNKEKHIKKLRAKYGIAEIKTECSDEEKALYKEMELNKQKLPDDIVPSYDAGYYTYYRKETPDYSDEELFELMIYKEIEILSDIRRHTGLFYTLAILGLIFSAVSLLITVANCAG